MLASQYFGERPAYTVGDLILLMVLFCKIFLELSYFGVAFPAYGTYSEDCKNGKSSPL
jgi:hypothetical protein